MIITRPLLSVQLLAGSTLQPTTTIGKIRRAICMCHTGTARKSPLWCASDGDGSEWSMSDETLFQPSQSSVPITEEEESYIMQTPSKRPPTEEAEDTEMPRNRRRQKKANKSTPPPSKDIPRETSGNGVTFPKSFTRMRLEAIFYPKFENEMEKNKSIRAQMKEKTAAGQGYLEVSVKHSGSLILWSGGERFYSKNSMCNVFTSAAEILLHQHFHRAYWNEKKGEEMFRRCSDFVEKNRLTLAFEVVTSCLGDHGDRPKKDFLVLTAVAVRSASPRFLPTFELVDLSQKYRLPHNDAWVFSSKAAVDSLFDLYDNSREEGIAGTIIPALSRAADVQVSSLYPHEVFQGDIMEGIVIRYVPCAQLSDALDRVKQLSETSQQILDSAVPPTLDACPDLIANDMNNADHDSPISPVLTHDIRKDFEDSKSRPTPSFEDQLAQILQDGGSQRESARPPRAASNGLPEIADGLRDSPDLETRKIARLISVLASLNDRVQYVLVQEKLPDRSRWLCIVHVIFDHTFPKYRKRKEDPADLELYRGFSFELIEDDDSINDNTGVGFSHDGIPETNEEPLMLKMKLLPYMVRTFCCRNGLVKVKHGGATEFSKYCRAQLSKWGISSRGRERWQPFFNAWGQYADFAMNKRGELPSNAENVKGAVKPKRMLGGDNYLDHVFYFTKLYESGVFSSATNEGSSSFQGLLIVVGPDGATTKSAADFVQKTLGATELENMTQLDKAMMQSLCAPGHGRVVRVNLADDTVGPSRVRKLLKAHKDDIYLLLFDTVGNENITDQRQQGILKAWRNTRVGKLFIMDRTSLMQEGDSVKPSDKFQSMLDEVAPRLTDQRPGMLVFFPQIPGCGKSCLAAQESELREIVEQGNQDQSRKLNVLAGDKIRAKYWPLVKTTRFKDPPSVVVADKNSPAPTWGLIGSVCAETQSFAIPVIPDPDCIRTTEVMGIKYLDGETNDKKKHIYPFSLAYLAVCLARVLERPPGSHAGKLDTGTPRACMIMLLFFGLYRRVNGEQFMDEMRARFESEGAVLSSSPIQLPFFKSNAGDIPRELKDVLEEGLRLQFGCEMKKKDSTKVQHHALDDMERKIRSVVAEHKKLLFNMTVPEEVTKSRLLSQLSEKVAACNEETSYNGGSDKKRAFIKLAAIDVASHSIHNVVAQLFDKPEAKSFFQQVVGERQELNRLFPIQNGAKSEDRRVVQKPHVTLIHFKNCSQQQFRDTYGPLAGSKVELRVQSLLWDTQNAALAVQVAPKTECCKDMPKSFNDFVHITIWVADGSSAYQSNQLPKRVTEGKAQRIEFAQPISLEGSVSLWEG